MRATLILELCQTAVRDLRILGPDRVSHLDGFTFASLPANLPHESRSIVSAGGTWTQLYGGSDSIRN